MSTEFESIDGWHDFSEQTNLSITRFYGGKKHGLSVQLTPNRGDYFCTDKEGVIKLIEQLSLAFDLPSTISRLEADKARLVEQLTQTTALLATFQKSQHSFGGNLETTVSDNRSLLAEMEKSND